MTAPEFRPAEVRTFTTPQGGEAVAWETDTPGMWIVPGSPITRLAPPGSGTALLVEAGTRYLPDPAGLDLDGHRAAVTNAIWGLASRAHAGHALALLDDIRAELDHILGLEHATGQHVGFGEPGCGLCEQVQADAQDAAVEDEAYARNAAMTEAAA